MRVREAKGNEEESCGIDGRAELVGAADVLGISGVHLVCRQGTRVGVVATVTW